VNPDSAEVVAEARLEKRPSGLIERLAWSAQDIVNDGWNAQRLSSTVSPALQQWVLLAALFALAAAAGGASTRALSLQQPKSAA
jgi:hypothetical protein